MKIPQKLLATLSPADILGDPLYDPHDCVSRPLAKVVPRPVEWLWPGRIPLGTLTLLIGDPGLGKSFLSLDIAARVSRATPWPDSPPSSLSPGPQPLAPLPLPAHVLLLSAEDDLARTIKPRLEAAGADPARITACEGIQSSLFLAGHESPRPFCLETDLPRLQRTLAQLPNVRLLIIDPITAYLGSTDSNRNADIRALLAALSGLAAQFSMAVLAVSHLHKAQRGKAVHRAIGSLAFTAASRAVWMVERDPANPTRRLFLPVKFNLGPPPQALAFTISDAGLTWSPEPLALIADDVITHESDERSDSPERTSRAEVAAWLRDLLSESDLPARDLFSHARDCGISRRAIREAKRLAGVNHYHIGKLGKSGGGRWMWTLRNFPELPRDAHPGAQVGQVGQDPDKNRIEPTRPTCSPSPP